MNNILFFSIPKHDENPTRLILFLIFIHFTILFYFLFMTKGIYPELFKVKTFIFFQSNLYGNNIESINTIVYNLVLDWKQIKYANVV